MRSVTVLKRSKEPGKYLEEDGPGLFHQWGMGYDEFETGPGMFSTAIVERPDGSVINIDADLIRFNVPAKETEG